MDEATPKRKTRWPQLAVFVGVVTVALCITSAVLYLAFPQPGVEEPCITRCVTELLQCRDLADQYGVDDQRCTEWTKDCLLYCVTPGS